jgi:ribosome-associated heat shock protein Hsp15
MDEPIRIDKWLWAARFFKTRSLASDAVERGRVRLNGDRCKPARNIRPGDLLDIDNGSTEDSLRQREQRAEQRKIFSEPGEALRGRPTKRDRRMIDRSRG